MTTAPRIHACLAVAGSFDPEDLNAMLGVTAKTTRAGQILPGGTRAKPSDRDLWHFSTPEENLVRLVATP